MRTAAILPVKRLAQAKRRLGASVTDPLRADLARAMVGDVLVALSETAAIARTIVVTSEESIAAAARYLDAQVVEDTAEEGQSAAVALGVERAIAEGYERVLCIPGDCPTLDPAELDALLGAPAHTSPAHTSPAHTSPAHTSPAHTSPAHTLPANASPANATSPATTIVPDRHGTGTNGLLLAPPDIIPASFGPGSCARHQALARAAGIVARIERPASLLLDVDTGEDLAALRARLSSHQAGAPRTRAVLGLSAAPCPACPHAA